MSQINEDKYVLGQSPTGTVSSSNDELELSLALQPSTASFSGGTVSGTVTGPSGPVNGAYVKLMNTQYQPIMHTVTNSQGQYTLTNVPVGNYYVFSIAPTMGLAQGNKVIDVAQFGNYPNENLVLSTNPNLQLGVITGDLTSQTGNTPISGAVVSLINTASGNTLTAVTYSNTQGQYAFREIPQGTYTIQVAAVGYNSTSHPSVVVPASGGIQNFNMTLTPTTTSPNGTVSGVITDATTKAPIPNADVILYSKTSSGLTPIAYTQTNDNGLYLFGNVQPGNYIIKSNISQQVSAPLNVVVKGSPKISGFEITGPIKNDNVETTLNKNIGVNEVMLQSPATIKNNLIEGISHKNGSISIKVEAPEEGKYRMIIKYVADTDNEIVNIKVNNDKLNKPVNFKKTTDIGMQSVDLILQKGLNTIEIYNG